MTIAVEASFACRAYSHFASLAVPKLGPRWSQTQKEARKSFSFEAMSEPWWRNKVSLFFGICRFSHVNFRPVLHALGPGQTLHIRKICTLVEGPGGPAAALIHAHPASNLSVKTEP